MSIPKNAELVCSPAVKYRFVKSKGLWCRTSFDLVKDDDGLIFKQRQAWHKDRNADWKDWGRF